MKSSFTAFAALLSLASLVNAAPAPAPTAGDVCIQVISTGPPIISPTLGLQLTGSAGTQATLQKTGLTQGWNFNNGGLGSPKYCTKAWLNIQPGAYPWKKLVWEATQKTTTWKTGYDVNLAAGATSTYNATSTFLACSPNYETFAPEMFLFLLTDENVTIPVVNDETLSNVNIKTCVKTKLHIPPDTIATVAA
ncbi:hypothetical protein FRC04_004565 [Tulasnella sp. 424]|nr:hypothetical protein FRC04_004565 [Tulasnella sp. 424]KAG8976635.1 hypothetical protein FRC05_003474 [Tulasnella sp. 425]